MVAREQHVGDLPAAELRRPSVVRVLESAAELVGERLELARALAERAGQPSRDRVDEHHRGQVAVREHVRADRDRVASRGARRCARRSPRSAPRGASRAPRSRAPRRSPASAGAPAGSARSPGWGGAPPYTASSAAATTSTRSTMPAPPPYGSSSTCAVSQRRRVAVREEAQVELAAEHRRDRALLGQPGERVRDEREDVELHQSANPAATTSMRRASRSTLRMQSSTIGSEHPGVELEHVVRDTGDHVRDRSERAAVLLHDLEPDELERVVLVLAGRRQRVALDLEQPSPRSTARSSLITGRPDDVAVADDLDRARRRRGSARRSSTSARRHSAARRRTSRRGRAGGRHGRSAPSRAAALQASRSPRRDRHRTSRFSSTKLCACGQALARVSATARSTSIGVRRNDGSPSSTSVQNAATSPSYGIPTEPALTTRSVADAAVELVMRVADHDRARRRRRTCRDDVGVGRDRRRDREVARRRRVAVEDAVDRRRQRQRLQPLEVAVGELRALPLLGQVLAVAAKHRARRATGAARPSRVGTGRRGSRRRARSHRRRRRRAPPRAPTASRGCRRARRLSHGLWIGDLDEHAPAFARGARADERPQRARDPP